MILFYHLKSGEIVGSINGRAHQPEELNMWMGDPTQIGRLIVEWKPVGSRRLESGEVIEDRWEPDTVEENKSLLSQFENNPLYFIENYKIDPATQILTFKSSEELEKQKQEKEVAEKELEQVKEKRKELKSKVSDKKVPLEKRFEALVELLDIPLTRS